jgi:hypothetical protein
VPKRFKSILRRIFMIASMSKNQHFSTSRSAIRPTVQTEPVNRTP